MRVVRLRDEIDICRRRSTELIYAGILPLYAFVWRILRASRPNATVVRVPGTDPEKRFDRGVSIRAEQVSTCIDSVTHLIVLGGSRNPNTPEPCVVDVSHSNHRGADGTGRLRQPKCALFGLDNSINYVHG